MSNQVRLCLRVCQGCITHDIQVMAMRASQDNDFAVTVSADHIVGRYNLTVSNAVSSARGLTANISIGREFAGQ